MSKITELKYTYRKNLGNYEHEETTVGGILEDDSNPVAFLNDLKALAQGQMNVPLAEIKTEVAESKSEPVQEPKAEKKSKAKKETTAKEPEQMELAEVAPAVETAEEKPEPAKKSKAVSKSKTAKYDRSNDLHKKFFGEILDTHFEGWKDNSAKAKEVSRKLEGADMLSSEGLVLEEFEKLVIKEMNS